MAGDGPEAWFSLETLTKHGTGIIIGAVGLAIAIKRGWVFMGDKTKLAVKLAIAEKDLEREREITADLRKQLARAQARDANEEAPA